MSNFIRSPERRELISLAIDCVAAGHGVALITLVNIEGNAPYPLGTQMLVRDDGQFSGQITGGCAEQAIADQAVQQIKFKQRSVHRYGLGSPYFDIQLPCGSGIDVVIDASLKTAELRDIRSQLLSRRFYATEINAGDLRYQKRYFPQPRLVFLGQGPILVSCARLALESGFDVMCVAQNAATMQLLNHQQLAGVELQKLADLQTVCDEFTGVVSLFHEHDHETEVLSQAVASSAFYVGALGSKKTHAARRDSLRLAGVSESGLARIQGPVGINIKARTPAQIAVSIIAQAIDYYNNSIDKIAPLTTSS